MFNRAPLTPLQKIGSEHLAWRSKVQLEHRSQLVSLERSVQDGLVTADKVAGIVATPDWMPMESHRKIRETFSPERLKERGASEEPYQRFPVSFEDSPVRGTRRSYKAPWATAKFALVHNLSPLLDTCSRRVHRESVSKRAVQSQKDAMERLFTQRFNRHEGDAEGEGRQSSVEKTLGFSFDARRSRNPLVLVKFPRVRRAAIL